VLQELCQSRYDFLPIEVVPNRDSAPGKPPKPPAVIYELRGQIGNDTNAEFCDYYYTAWGAMRGPCPDYEKALESLVQAVQLQPGEEQVMRLLRIAAWGKKEPDALPTPYHRTFSGWADYEASSAKVPLPEGVKNLKVEDVESRKNSVHGKSAEFEAVHAALDTDTLRKEIELARSQVRKDSDSSEGDTKKDAEEDTNCFTCQLGSRWWRAKKCLGAGGFGEVWLGMGEGGGLCALKYLPLPAAPATKSRLRPGKGGAGTDKIDELLAEVKLMRDLRHDNIVCVMSSAVVRQSVVIVMEFVPGGSLQAVLEQFGPLPEPSLKRYTRDILRGLLFLHENEVVHRDLKPANVLLQIDGECKLADFGAAAELSAATQQKNLGTPLYMAPEAARGEVERASDIWSLGITLYHLAAGNLPWDNVGGEGMVTFMRRLAKSEEMVPEVTTEKVGRKVVADFISVMLLRDPDHRPDASRLLVHQFLS